MVEHYCDAVAAAHAARTGSSDFLGCHVRVSVSLAKITGHRTPASQLSAAVSTDYTQHMIPRLRRNMYTGAHECIGLCVVKGASRIQLHPRFPAQTLLKIVNSIVYFQFQVSLFTLFGYYYGEIGMHLIIETHLNQYHCKFCKLQRSKSIRNTLRI